jgi:phosphoesterase RecJ-like protein
MKRDWSQVKQIIQQHQKFILTTHINPDGDGLGSEIALAEYLKSIGKQATIINKTPMANNYKFLDPFNEILVYEAAKHQHLLEEADVFLILDISDWGRLREVGSFIKESSRQKVCIDHHHCPYPFTEMDVIDSKVSSTGELVFDLLRELGALLNQRIADAIYTCILTDTGSFRFSNTTPRAHHIVAELIEIGVNSRKIYESVYEQNSAAKMRLLGMILQKLNFDCSGNLAWFNITQKMLEQTGANSWDTEGFADFPRSIEGVEVSLMFTEIEPNRTKISFRSKGRIIVNTLSMKLGGGGHEFASGAMLEYPLRQANAIVLDEARRLFDLSC